MFLVSVSWINALKKGWAFSILCFNIVFLVTSNLDVNTSGFTVFWLFQKPSGKNHIHWVWIRRVLRNSGIRTQSNIPTTFNYLSCTCSCGVALQYSIMYLYIDSWRYIRIESTPTPCIFLSLVLLLGLLKWRKNNKLDEYTKFILLAVNLYLLTQWVWLSWLRNVDMWGRTTVWSPQITLLVGEGQRASSCYSQSQSFDWSFWGYSHGRKLQISKSQMNIKLLS